MVNSVILIYLQCILSFVWDTVCLPCPPFQIILILQAFSQLSASSQNRNSMSLLIIKISFHSFPKTKNIFKMFIVSLTVGLLLGFVYSLFFIQLYFQYCVKNRMHHLSHSWCLINIYYVSISVVGLTIFGIFHT